MKQGKIMRALMLALAVSPAFAQTTTTAPPSGRLLASNCFQCHGTNGSGGFERLAGESVSEIYNELKEMQRKSPPKMMDMHARGYTDAQIRLIADYLSKQR
jgi:cytochrome subunit of sulfide dehydrogenase